MELESVVITGANRGIGLEFVKQLVKLPNPPPYVFASYRSENAIQELKRIQDGAEKSEVILIKMDVSNVDDIRGAKRTIKEKLGNRGLNLLVNNAGIGNDLLFPNLTEQNLLSHYSTNALGPVILLQELLPLLQTAADRNSSGSRMGVTRAAVLNISSNLGSVAEAISGPMPEALAYMMSKAALNIGMRVIAGQLKDKGILLVLMCPGWVKTDMGTENAELEVNDSIAAIFRTLSQLNEEHHGAFMDRNGKTIPF